MLTYPPQQARLEDSEDLLKMLSLDAAANLLGGIGYFILQEFLTQFYGRSSRPLNGFSFDVVIPEELPQEVLVEPPALTGVGYIWLHDVLVQDVLLGSLLLLPPPELASFAQKMLCTVCIDEILQLWAVVIHQKSNFLSQNLEEPSTIV
jgi:hypothetical protein